MFNKEKIQQLVDNNYLIVGKHSTLDLSIYNYSRKTQYDAFWNEITLSCRGLILDSNYNVVARAFKKFFNYEELKNKDLIPWNLKYKVYSKLDGSLGILFNYNNIWYMASRGSFNSEQAQFANELLNTKYTNLLNNLNKDYTYLFEIIYPENRIVVDYNGLKDIFLLAVINKNTEEEYDIYSNEINAGFNVVKRYTEFENKTVEELQSLNIQNEEGFVFVFENGFRFKAKFEEYVRLHKVLSNMTEKSLWEMLYNNVSIDSILDQIPDEMDNWIRKTYNEYNVLYDLYESKISDLYKEIKHIEDKKEFALLVLNNIEYKKYSGILFNMKSNKDYSKLIWKLLEPKKESTRDIL